MRSFEQGHPWADKARKKLDAIAAARRTYQRRKGSVDAIGVLGRLAEVATRLLDRLSERISLGEIGSLTPSGDTRVRRDKVLPVLRALLLQPTLPHLLYSSRSVTPAAGLRLRELRRSSHERLGPVALAGVVPQALCQQCLLQAVALAWRGSRRSQRREFGTAIAVSTCCCDGKVGR